MTNRSNLSLVLASALFASNFAIGKAPPNFAERIAGAAPGTVVEVKLAKAEVLRGRLLSVSKESFRMQHAQGDRVVEREVSYQDVRAFKRMYKSNTVANGISWGIVGALAVIGIVVLAALISYVS